eukprot:gb/GECG01013986.1/.p1 GENE.gb/GECG01013986.1/~~gb/GECG01013986.1/.p1  ORF type:complete len:335 (+),score=27.45 gb/GECG01013986.1/:1-1005(+)
MASPIQTAFTMICGLLVPSNQLLCLVLRGSVDLLTMPSHETAPLDQKQHVAPLPFWKNVLAGAFAGATELLAMYPTDVVKTRAQLATTGTTSLVGTLTNIVKEEGIFALYRGLASPLMIEPMKRSVKFAANSKFKELFMGSHHEENTIRHFSAGACAGMTEILVISPFEVVKVRLQAKERKSVYKNSFDAFGKMLKAEGPLVFYTGFEAALIRQAMWNGPYFASIYKLKQILPHPNSKPEELLYKFLSGVAGGVIGTTCNTPLDVVTSRMRNVLPGEVTKYRYSLQSVTLILREEGIRSLYRGYVPKVVRLGPGGGIMIVMFEFAQKMLQTPST